MMHTLGENPTENEVNEMMREADRDLDGKISFSEFIEMIRYP
jgi:Ca2+-binding EF-hand superfamily protein